MSPLMYYLSTCYIIHGILYRSPRTTSLPWPVTCLLYQRATPRMIRYITTLYSSWCAYITATFTIIHTAFNLHVSREVVTKLVLLIYHQGYGRGGTPLFTAGAESLAPLTRLYRTEINAWGDFFGAASPTVPLETHLEKLLRNNSLRPQGRRGSFALVTLSP